MERARTIIKLQYYRSMSSSDSLASSMCSMVPDLPSSEPHEVKRAPLDSDFVPNNYSVMTGRRKECYNTVGNRRCRVITTMHLERYCKAHSMAEKNQIISNVVDIVRQSGGAFLKFDQGIWWEIGDAMAR